MGALLYYWSKLAKKIRYYSKKNSSIGKGSKIESGSSFVNSSISKYSFCGYDCDILNTDIGSYCSIANYVAIGGGKHPVEWVGTSPVFYDGRDSVTKKFASFKRENPKRVQIGSDVWIGYRSIVMQGVTIGHGAVVGAGSIVTKDVPPYSVVAGVPARIIRYRFSGSIRDRLLDSKWWELEENKLEECANLIRDPEQFLRMLGK